MLTNISISNLFSLYSYELDLKTEDSSVCFITGPNGYGKTSILKIIDNIYNGRWENLFDICFEKIGLTFSGGVRMSVVQTRKSLLEEDSDELIDESVSLNVNFQLTSDYSYSFEVKNHSEKKFIPDKNIELFFDSHPVSASYTPRRAHEP